MARVRARKRPMSEMNVVPYIDVMLVLLVIFMITAPLLSQGVKVDLPQTPSQPLDRRESEPLVVVVDQEGRFYLQFGDERDKPVDSGTLVTRVAAVRRHQPDVPVLVKGDRNAAYGDVVVVMALLQRAGVDSVGLMTEAPLEPER